MMFWIGLAVGLVAGTLALGVVFYLYVKRFRDTFT